MGGRIGTLAWATLACALLLGACSEEPQQTANPAMGFAGMLAGASGVPGGAAGVAAPTAGMTGAGAAGVGTSVGGMAAPTPVAGTTGGTGVVAGTGGSGTGGMGAPPPAGTGGSEGGAPAPEAGTDGGGGTAAPEDLGMGDGSDVITIGDSWMSLGFDGIQTALRDASGQPYRVYGVAGTQMLTGEIPGQYDRAKGVDPDIKTVVMTGGGNDVILNGLGAACAAGTDSCRMRLERIVAAFDTLWAEMAADGVRDVILVHYASDAGDGLNPSLMHDERLMMHAASVPAPMRCHLLFTDDIVMGQYSDGIHPTPAAYDRLGQAVFDMMVAEGMRR
jgi:hypothetical protein